VAKSDRFPGVPNLSFSERMLLSEAYERACDELIAEYGYTFDQLDGLAEPMTVAILAMYRAGQRDGMQLSRYAASKAIFGEISKRKDGREKRSDIFANYASARSPR
jgi:hypothetical protein